MNRPLPPPTSFLFDLDGTLLDSLDLILASYRHTFRSHDREPPPDAEWLRTLGIPLRQQFKVFVDDQAIESWVATYREYYFEHHDALMRPYPGIVEAVHELRKRAFKLAVITSKLTDTTLRALSFCGLTGQDGALFDAIITADDVDKPKPDPEPVLLALDKIGVVADTAVFVGDSIYDLAAGNAASVRTAAVLWGAFSRAELASHEPTWWLETPADLLKLGDAFKDS